jgi:hypothetical protein
MQEVDGDDALGLVREELPPGRAGAAWGRVDARRVEDLPYRGCGDGVSESGQLALDPPVPPLCVLSSELQDQLLERCLGRRPSGAGAPGAVVPLRRDEPAMPGQQGPGSNREDLVPAATGYQAGECSQPEPVRWLVTDRAGELTAQHRILMPEDEQLGFLIGVAAQQHPGDGQQPAGHLVQHRDDHADMVPAENPLPSRPAAMTLRAPQGGSQVLPVKASRRTVRGLTVCLIAVEILLLNSDRLVRRRVCGVGG